MKALIFHFFKNLFNYLFPQEIESLEKLEKLLESIPPENLVAIRVEKSFFRFTGDLSNPEFQSLQNSFVFPNVAVKVIIKDKKRIIFREFFEVISLNSIKTCPLQKKKIDDYFNKVKNELQEKFGAEKMLVSP